MDLVIFLLQRNNNQILVYAKRFGCPPIHNSTRSIPKGEYIFDCNCFIHMIQSSYYYMQCYKEEDRIIFYIHLHPLPTLDEIGNSPHLTYLISDSIVTDIYVPPSKRRQGYATLLFKELFKWCKVGTLIYLDDCSELYRTPRNLYLKLGFSYIHPMSGESMVYRI